MQPPPCCCCVLYPPPPPLVSAYLFCLSDAEELGCKDSSQLSAGRNAETRWEAQLWGEPSPSTLDFMA